PPPLPRPASVALPQNGASRKNPCDLRTDAARGSSSVSKTTRSALPAETGRGSASLRAARTSLQTGAPVIWGRVPQSRSKDRKRAQPPSRGRPHLHRVRTHAQREKAQNAQPVKRRRKPP